MTQIAPSTRMTAAQLLQASDLGRCELVQGELAMMSPAGFEHGRIVNNVAWFLTSHVRQHDLGIVTGAETGFHIARNPDTVRAPDIAFLRSDRVPQEPVRGFFDGPPDLAVEVMSPDDRAAPSTRKLLPGCVPAVWKCGWSTRNAARCKSIAPAPCASI